MKKLSLLTMGLGSATLLAAGAAMAAPPSGFGYSEFTVNAGQVTAGACPVGYTCQVLQNDTGFLQQRVSDGTANGTYFHTIVTSDDASALDQAQVEALDFRNENFVGAGVGGVASLSSVQLEGGAGTGQSEIEINGGGMQAGTDMHIVLTQTHEFEDRGQSLVFEDAGGSAQGNGTRMVMNQDGGTFSGPMTVRVTDGSFTVCDTGTGCVLELPDGQQLTYDSGDEIGTMYQHQALFGMGGTATLGAENRVFENQTFTVNGDTIGWTNVSNNMDDFGGGGILLPDPQGNGNGGAAIGGVTFSTVNADGGEWDYWDDNFGAAPLGVEPPAAFPSDPFGP